MREILTLQLGQLSNYVATHFWNAQESYFTYSGHEESLVDHNVHWRAGIGADGSETFLPRTVIYDLKGGFGSLRKINALYEAEAEPSAKTLWPGPSTVHKQPALEPSAYQQSLDAGTQPPPLTSATVRYWSDFSRVYFHPRSVVQLYDFELNSTTMPFERFSMGTELFHTLDKEHDLADRDWRPFAEECDCMQGIQVFTTLDDAWAGFASSYLETLRDEFPKSTIWVWGLQSPMLGSRLAKRQLRLTNVAHSIDAMSSQASTLVPLALPEDRLAPGVELDYSSPWHASSVMAAAIETAILPSRLAPKTASQPASLEYLAESLNAAGNQPLAALAASTNRPSVRSAEAEDGDEARVDLFQVGRERGQDREHVKHMFAKVSTARGFDPMDQDQDRDQDQNELDHRSRPHIGGPVVRSYETTLEFPLLDSYPRVYTRHANQTGLSIASVLSTDSRMVARMRSLRSQVTWTIGVEDRETLSNSLAELADAYQDDWSSGSDEDDDDA